MTPLPVFALLLLSALWAAVFYRISDERVTALKQAFSRSEVLVQTFEERSAGILRQIDQTSQFIKYEYEKHDGTFVLPQFTKKKGMLPTAAVLRIDIADHNGSTGANSQPSTSGNLADHEHIKIHAARDTGELFIGKPLLESVSGKWSIPMTRRINHPDGSFAGAILISVDPSYFTNFYKPSDFGKQGSLALLGVDGAIRVHRIGDQVSFSGNKDDFSSLLQHASQRKVNELAMDSPFDHVRRIFSHGQLDEFPLVAVVGIAEEEALTEFYRHRTIYFWSGAAGSTLITTFVALLMLQSGRLRTSARAAKDAQATFRAAAEGSLDAFYILKSLRGPDNRIEDFVFTDLNDRGAKLLGKSKTEIVGRKLCELLPMYRSSAFFDKHVQVVEEHKPLDEEFELNMPEFQAHWLQQQIVPIDDGIAITMRNISERKDAEMELRTKQAELAAANDASPLGLFRTGPNGACTYVNRTYEEMSGLTRDEAMGDGWARSIHPEDRLKVFQAWGQSSRNKQPYQGVYRFKHADGRIVWASVKTAPILVDDQLEGYVGSVDDITARREAEQALRESEARLRTIADTLPAMIAYVDANQHYRFNNLAYERILGISREAMRDKHVRDILGEATYLRLEPFIQRALQGETVTFELEDQTDDSYICAELNYIPQFSDDGKQVLGFHVMNQDITAKKLEEKRLVQLAQVDSLTGLINRAGFNQRLTDAMVRSRASHALIAVMYLDIDHFKQINDTYGHQAGDVLLKAFVGRLSRTLRSSDTVARLGGDEFTVIMEKLTKPEDAATVATKIVQTIQTPFPLEQRSLSVTVSIGLAFYQGGATDRKSLIRQADEMLYQAKAAGRNTYRIAPLPTS